MTADKRPEWDDEEAPSCSLKLFKLSSTSVKSWSTPELRAEGVLGEPGCEDGFCMVCTDVVSNISNRHKKLSEEDSVAGMLTKLPEQHVRSVRLLNKQLCRTAQTSDQLKHSRQCLH